MTKEYKSRKKRRKYCKNIVMRNYQEHLMDIEEQNILYSRFNFFEGIEQEKNSNKKRKSKEAKIKELHSNVEDFIAGKRSNNMVCCNSSEAKKVQKIYKVKLVKKEPVNTKYGLFMYQIILV